MLNDTRDRKCLSTARDAEQHLIFCALVEAFHKRVDSRWLIAFWAVLGLKSEFHDLIDSKLLLTDSETRSRSQISDLRSQICRWLISILIADVWFAMIAFRLRFARLRTE